MLDLALDRPISVDVPGVRVDFEDYQDDDSFFFGRFLASEEQREVLWSATEAAAVKEKSGTDGSPTGRVQGMLALNGLPEPSLKLRKAVSTALAEALKVSSEQVRLRRGESMSCNAAKRSVGRRRCGI